MRWVKVYKLFFCCVLSIEATLNYAVTCKHTYNTVVSTDGAFVSTDAARGGPYREISEEVCSCLLLRLGISSTYVYTWTAFVSQESERTKCYN